MNVFNTDKNKSMLWSILDKQGKFNHVPQNVNIVKIFESTIKQTEIQCNGNETLVNMNKSFLSGMIKELSIYISPSVLKKNKTEMFNNSLQEKEQSFKDMMKVPTPATVDFSDGKGDEPIGNIDELLSKQLEKRNLDMPTYNNIDENSVKEWLTGESTTLPPPKPKNKEAHIKIGELVNQNVVLDITPIKKTVKWSDEKNSIPDNTEVISKKPEPTEIKSEEEDIDIKSALVKVLKNQEYIITAIHDLQDRI
tara:strand:- start:13044 stop:13799 length:756 start_codon:yes stop_codon:yes gene_type:complete